MFVFAVITSFQDANHALQVPFAQAVILLIIFTLIIPYANVLTKNTLMLQPIIVSYAVLIPFALRVPIALCVLSVIIS